MNHRPAFLLLAVSCLAPVTSAEPGRPQPILPDALEWFSPVGDELIRGAWVLGSEKGNGIYAFRVRLGEGARIPVHTHPDTRFTTVLSGTLYVGFGAVADESRMVAVPAGAVYVAPAKQPHYLWARDGDVVYQEGGVGPTATSPGP